ncbi:MAG TPA: tRNA-dihydrouridine synthase [Solirubrobacteraceae bacterium]|nr:tRNA-dihydrouridine synthase [Solirubrobacteraceae bacterium]
MPTPARLDESWLLGSLRVPNRVLLAPLAGIGNWFVRLQAKRFGAGLAVSEMVSSHAIHHGNPKTCTEMLRIDPREHRPDPPAPGGVGGPVSIQLFGEDPAVMRSAAAHVVVAGADAIDINMGCPVPKVRKTGAGAALLDDPDLAVEVARAAVQGAQEGRERVAAPTGHPRAGAPVPAAEQPRSDAPVPVTVKLRSGVRPGEESGFTLAHRLVEDAGVAAIGFHPRSAAVHHKGAPDYRLAARLVRSLPAPVILTGGMDDAHSAREAFAATGAAAVMLARGALGNPWLFAELVHGRQLSPSRQEVLAELHWTIDRAVEHLGEERATRYLRKFYPWYVPRLALEPAAARGLQESLQAAPTLTRARELLAGVREAPERVARAPAPQV